MAECNSSAQEPRPEPDLAGSPRQMRNVYRNMMSRDSKVNRPISSCAENMLKRNRFVFWLLSLVLIAGPASAWKSSNETHEQSGTTVLVQLDSPDSQVRQAVEEVAGDQIIHGTYSFEKEKTLYGAHAADSSVIFGSWESPGKAFYKVAENVLAPRFFKDSGDVGTITVRYVVQAIGPSSTVLRIDAIYFDARHVRHKSNGSVESKEYEAVQDHLRSIQAQQKQDAEAEQRIAQQRAATHPSQAAKEVSPSATAVTASSTATPRMDAESSTQSLEQKVESLRRQVELQVKSSGAVLKSAPYKSAATIQSLPASTVVVVVVLTPYWYGVQTEDGQKGWVHRSEVEQLP